MEKIEKIRDDFGEISGYKLGKYYLMKFYGFGGSYSWGINTSGNNFYFHCDIEKAGEEENLEWVESFKEGKKKLIEYYEKDLMENN